MTKKVKFMTIQIKKSIIRLGLPFLVLLTALVCMIGCATSHPDPLAGFHFSSLNNLDSNKVITDDYKDYIHTLSSEESKYAGPIHFFEDGTGQHAVQITIGINGTVWEHVLIYDKKNGSSTFLVGKAGGIGFSGGAYDTGKSVSTDIGAG